jgi:hypothetical protein
VNEKIQTLLSAVRQRDWCPIPKAHFVKWTTTRSGYRIYAGDYGYCAFPIRERSPAGSIRTVRPRFEPILNGVTLANGLKAGNHVKVQDVGTGVILLITPDTVVVQLDGSGYLLERAAQILSYQVQPFQKTPALIGRQAVGSTAGTGEGNGVPQA